MTYGEWGRGHRPGWLDLAAVRLAHLSYANEIDLACGRLALWAAGCAAGEPPETVDAAIDMFVARLTALIDADLEEVGR